jgi:protein O-GlcNAc transferase
MSQHAAKLEHIRALLQTRPDQARALCQRLAQSAPRDPYVQSTMARVLLFLGATQQGLHFAQRAADLAPNDPEMLMIHAEMLGYENQHEKALAAVDRALAVAPGHGGALYHRIIALQNMDRFEEAETACRRVLALDPDNAGLRSLLAGILLNLGRIEEAVAAIKAASEAHPDDKHLASGLALMLNYMPGAKPRDVLAAHTRYAQILDRAEPAPPRTFTNSRDPDRRLRLGLLSPDLRQHSVAYFIEPWLAHVRPESFELIVYQTNRVADAVTARLKALVLEKGGAWHVMDNISDPALAERIYSDRIDILLELSGHTHAHSLPALHRRPAPVQATYLGYPNTTGLSAVDYRIVDSITDPPGAADELATEKLVRMDPFICYRPPGDAPAPRAARHASHITFGSFNTLQKLNDRLVLFWTRVLEAVPGSRLLLKGGSAANPSQRDSIFRRFTKAGLDPTRLEFLPRTQSIADHLALYEKVDIALDPFPYNGTTTTCEALFMGVPVITLAGDVHAGRVGASLLTCVGLKDLIADSEDGYIAIARQLAADTTRRAGLRTGLRATLLASPLCDAAAFSQRMDQAFRTMWRAWCASP